MTSPIKPSQTTEWDKRILGMRIQSMLALRLLAMPLSPTEHAGPVGSMQGTREAWIKCITLAACNH